MGCTKINFDFPAGVPSPAHPNMDPRCNSLALCPPGLPVAVSPLIREAWSFHLADYPEHEFVSAVLNIIDVRASIGHSGPQTSQSCNNLRSDFDHSAVVSKEIGSIISGGCIHGPFEELPLPNFYCSPLGTSTHKCNPKCWVFNHGLKVTQPMMRLTTRRAPFNMTPSSQQPPHCRNLGGDPYWPSWASRMHTGTL